MANELNDINDVEAKCPGVVSGIREWFRWYKTPDDKPVNEFGFGEKALPKADALKVGGWGGVGGGKMRRLLALLTLYTHSYMYQVIDETHGAWKGMMNGAIDGGKLWKKQ